METRRDEHELIGPSSFKAIRICPGRLLLHENVDSEPAIWGNRCHALSEHWLKTGIQNYHGVMEEYAKEYPEQYTYDKTDPVDQEMIDTAKYYVDYCLALGPGEVKIEEKVMLCEDCGGTADFSHEGEAVFTIVDLKGGAGVEVDAEQNEQEMIYAAASVGEELDFYDVIRLVIVQPRIKTGPPVKVWEITPQELRAWLEAVCYPAIIKIKDMLVAFPLDMVIDEESITWIDEAGYLVADMEACRWCSAKGTCPAAARAALSAACDDFSDLAGPVPAGTSVLTAQGLEILAKAPLIRKVLGAVEDMAFKDLQDGIAVEGFKLVAGRRSKAWCDAAKAEEWLKARRFKQEEMYSQKLISPAAAITLVKGRRFAKDLDEHYTVNDGKPTMAPASDKREALKTQTAEDDFAEFVKE